MMDVFLSESDWESISESGSSEDQEETEYLYSGQARSILSSLEESIEKIDDFLSFERGFFHGDLVCSVTDPSGQMGRVVGVDMLVDLESVKGKILKNVNSQTLLKIRSISVGDYVVCGPWLGRVDKVVDKVTVIFDDGSKCEVTAMDQEKLLPLSPNLLDDSQYPYYPGQRVRVGLLNVSKPAKWLCGTWRRNQDEGTVFSVEAGLVYVDWLASAPMGCDLSLPAPPCLQDSKNLTLLACFPYTNWQLGDWCMLPSADSKGVMDQTFLNTSTGHCIKEHENLARGFQRTHLSSNVEEIFVIVKTRTKVDVVWQDGSHSFGLDSQKLLPISVVNTYEFCPEQFVLEKGTFDDPHMSSSRKWGVVLSADAKERTVKVWWKILAMTEANNLDGDRTEETLSAYELIEHPDFSYCFGDVVFRLIQNQFGVPADKDHVYSETDMSEASSLIGDNCNKNQNQYLSCIGLVTGFKDGAVEVKWATGSATKVAPYEIFRIDKVEDSTTTHVLYEENVEESNQEIIEHEKQSHNHKGKDLFDSDGSDENYKRHSWEFSSFFLPKATIGFFTSIAASLFGSVGSTSLSCPVVSGLISEDGNESGSLHEKEVLETCDLLHTFRHTSSDHEVEETLDKDNDVLPFSKASENSDLFRQFDMVGDCSDHHFLGAGEGLALSQVKSSWLKTIQQEWSILEKNLPETIYVRVFEERMDLLRAAIVGAPGTPYHDGLFFFDISLPLEYPHEPPSVHYNSGGLRVNPNLYESGKVCLSLLNTWTGTGSEAWNPGSSTILQVLLSLQALVLNEKPYFNEAGYDQQIGRAEGEKNSVSYNENAFLGTCKSMLYLLQKPPKNFEALVEEHFRRRSQNILMACKAYMEGAPVGCALGCGKTEGENLKGSSTGFKIMLAKLLPKLAEAFSGQGMDCSKFIEPEK